MLKYAMISRDGCRDHNEDSVKAYAEEDRGCFALADGLGGHGKGEVASAIAVETFITGSRAGAKDAGPDFQHIFSEAQSNIISRQREDRSCSDMKTTLTGLIISETDCRWAHIGDSRLYYFENKRIKTRTMDHSVPQMLVSVGEIEENEIRHHPDRNRLLKVLGDVAEEDEEDNFGCTEGEPVFRQKNQAFLMCSDGFWELIEESEMEELLQNSQTPEEWLAAMEQVVLRNGTGTNMDNYSALAVWSEKEGKKGFSWRFPWKK